MKKITKFKKLVTALIVMLVLLFTSSSLAQAASSSAKLTSNQTSSSGSWVKIFSTKPKETKTTAVIKAKNTGKASMRVSIMFPYDSYPDREVKFWTLKSGESLNKTVSLTNGTYSIRLQQLNMSPYVKGTSGNGSLSKK
ncbi:hypothetical protein [Priestia megaterium]|uniref:hypothetical protein n=1 Tax=Priestia megaterium TaxID=1404 RepID=UPI000BF82BE0|nr:hypothetical protein [Priestia megaterium]PER67545.1 hypothetical protein CN492_25105 [Priestia megaterium]